MTNVQDKKFNINPQIKGRGEDKPNGGRGTQCFEYEGFRHIKLECSTFLKKQKMELFVTWYDSDNESEEEAPNNMMTYSGRYEYQGDSCTGELSE